MFDSAVASLTADEAAVLVGDVVLGDWVVAGLVVPPVDLPEPPLPELVDDAGAAPLGLA